MVVRFVALVVLLVAACNGQKKSAVEGSAAPSDPQLSLIVHDFYAPVDSTATLVIKNRKDLLKFYAQINMTRKPGLPVPNIDFSKEMVVVRCVGEQAHSGFPELSVMKETPEAIILGLKGKKSKNIESAVTNAFSVYKMPLTQKRIVVVPKE